MNIKTFKAKLSLYGSDFTRWPENIRQEARTLIAGSEEAAALYNESKDLDALLDNLTAPPAPAINTDRILLHQARYRPSVMATIQERLSALLAKPAFSAGLAAFATFILLMVYQPFGPESVTTNRIDVPLNVAIEPFLAEWEQMAAMSQQDLQQAEELFGLLPASDTTDDTSIAGIQAFLDEIEAGYAEQQTEIPLSDDLWQYFAAEVEN